MNFICKPSKVQIYINTDYYTLAQIKAKTGCDAVINGGLFNMSSFKAVCHLRADGKTYSNETWSRDGLGWNNLDITMDAASNMGKYNNYINCVEMVKGGKSVNMSYNKDLGGSRQRTAFGVFEDGRVWMFAQQSPTLTPEQLRTKALEAGVKHAIMLDGGGSTQCIFPSGSLTSARKVHNVICVWADDVGSNTDTSTDVNLETRPTSTLRKGAIGSDVKWVQNRLIKLGYEVANDGIYSSGTYNAVKKFQTYWGLDVDGIFGTASLDRLITAVNLLNSNNKLISTAVKYVGVTEPSGDDDIIKSYNNLAGASFGYSVAWCQMFVVMMQKYAGLAPYITASCTTARNYYKLKGVWVTAPKPGYLIYFDWDRSGDCDHVGIVVSVIGNTVGVIEGNASNSTGNDAVCYKEYQIGYSKIAGYANIGGVAAESNIPTTDTGKPKETVASSNIKSKVMTFQRYLNNKLGANLAIDGVYGKNTRNAAVKLYQQFLNDRYRAGLVADGIFGSKTKSAAKDIKLGDSDTSVWILQGVLYCRGYDPKYLDGQFGSGTKQAVINFQKDNKLTADGIIGPVGLGLLFA